MCTVSNPHNSSLWHHCYFTDEETGPERSSTSLKVTQLVNSGVELGAQLVRLQSLYCNLAATSL